VFGPSLLWWDEERWNWKLDTRIQLAQVTIT
jgi:hypothetical protein